MSHKPATTGILALPAEIRVMIFRLLLVRKVPIRVVPIRDQDGRLMYNGPKVYLRSLCFPREESHSRFLGACKLFTHEGLPLLYSANTFHFGSLNLDTVQGFLSLIGLDNAKLLRHVTFQVPCLDILLGHQYYAHSPTKLLPPDLGVLKLTAWGVRKDLDSCKMNCEGWEARCRKLEHIGKEFLRCYTGGENSFAMSTHTFEGPKNFAGRQETWFSATFKAI